MDEMISWFEDENEFANCMIEIQENGTPTDIAQKYKLEPSQVAVLFREILRYKGHKLEIKKI